MKGKKATLLFSLLAAVLFLRFTPQSVQAAAVGEVEQYAGNGHYYCVFNKSMTWSRANTYCNSLGGYLATVTSQSEEDFVEDLLSSYATKSYFWLGGTDEETEGVWKWVTGETWGYTNWDKNSPNNSKSHDSVHGQDYLLIEYLPDFSEYHLFWDDQPNDGISGDSKYYNPPYNQRTEYYGFICEWDSAADVPTDIEARKVISITLSGSRTLTAGKRMTLTAKVSPSDADNQTLQWTSSNTSVAVVSSTGKVTGRTPGTALITATAKDGSGISASLRIVVKPKKTTLSQASSTKKRQLTVQWKKQSGVTGYQVQYAADDQFLSAKTKAVKSANTALTIKKVTSKKVYYVRVRSYKKIGTKYYYGAWSKVKTVKIK